MKLEKRYNRILLHGLFWISYMLYNSFKTMAFWPDFFANFATVVFVVPFMAIAVYLNFYVFIPKLFQEKRYVLYGVSVISTLIIIPLISLQALRFYFGIFDLSNAIAFFYNTQGYLIWFSEVALVFAITTAIKATKSWMLKERYARELEKEKAAAEISFFKQQINPHLVFNVLNSIYFAIPKSQELAQDIVMRLSDMLSHQLYDANKDWIPLHKEIEYLHNYIAIERIRQGDALHLDCQLPQDQSVLQISPILLLPFVENAFKYAPTANPSDYWVKITLTVENNQLHFQVENPFTEGQTTTRHQKGGIGIANVKNRLNLIYPKKHKLRISQEDNTWKVDLMMELSELENQPLAPVLS